MNIRRAQAKDAEALIRLLHQVLELHAALRPDIFISGTTKHTIEELETMIVDDTKPIYVAVDDDDAVLGYAFCEIKEPVISNNRVPFRALHIDDLCVDEQCRGQHVGKALYDFCLAQAKAMDCYEVTLNVWEGNTAAQSFYEKQGMRVKMTQMETIL